MNHVAREREFPTSAGMGRGRTCWLQQLLLVSLGFSSLMYPAASAEMEVMTAPSTLHAGTAENIFVEIQDCIREADICVQIMVKNFPTKTRTMASVSVTLTKAKNYQDFGRITIPVEPFSEDPDVKQYVFLQARFPDRQLEKIVLVSFQSGYIFIQTDKHVYAPESQVLYRIFAVNHAMQAVGTENDGETEDVVDVEIVSPDGLKIQHDSYILQSGIFSGSYLLPDFTNYGQWQVVAKFQNDRQHTFAANFEVKEFVPPSFEVKLTPVTSFFYADGDALTVNIRARYVFGKEVDGTAYVVFGIIDGGEKRSFPASLQRVPVTTGHGQATMKREHIMQVFPNMGGVAGQIFAAVSVLTDSGHEMVEAECRDIRIVTSPYTITFRRTSRYFKPGMSSTVTVEVLNPDGTPAPGVPVTVDPSSVTGITSVTGTARFDINTMTNSETLTITAKTNDPGIPPQRQASATMTAYPHKSKSNPYMKIDVENDEVEVGVNMKLNIIMSRPEGQRDITLLFLSRGQLLKYERHKSSGRMILSLVTEITKEMLPSFRIIAYYHTSSKEVVSASVRINVKHTCLGTLKLEILRPTASYEPHKSLDLKITGDPEATVGLLAVDKSVYASDKQHLVQKKIWETVETYDSGCTPGGGKDSMNVFYDAGLLFESGTDGTPYRTDVKCPAASRKKRDITSLDYRTRLVSRYEDETERKCCLEGMRSVQTSFCEKHSQYVVEGPACMEAFMHCCTEVERHGRTETTVLLSRSKRQTDGYSDGFTVRSTLHESWLWTEIKLSACPPNDSTCALTSLVKKVFLPDSVRSWHLTAISLSRTGGICVSDALEVNVQKNVFIDLTLPYSAVFGQRLELKAVLHNNLPERITVRVDLEEEENVCSAAYRQERYRQEVQVGPHSSRLVPFFIIPMKVGEITIKLKASVKNTILTDGVQKKLRVVPEGFLVKVQRSVSLNPTKSGVAGYQVETLNSNIPSGGVLSNTPTSTFIYLTGKEPLNLRSSGASVGRMIQTVYGSGENCIFFLCLTVTATVYLDKTNQWDAVGIEKRDDALMKIKEGHQLLLLYRKVDGSYSMFASSKSSTWLTAFVARVFAMAHSLLALDQSPLCDAVKFLILTEQQPDGKFSEGHRVYHTEMTGDVSGTDSDASMTAFCLMALKESQAVCSNTVNVMSWGISRAVTYLENRLPHLIHPYAVAMTSYALATENKLNKEILFKFAAPDRSHWPVSQKQLYTLEATAYAALALIKAKDFASAKPVMEWINRQPRVNGNSAETQAIFMVHQALAEYWTHVKDPEQNLLVELSVPGISRPVKHNFNKDNFHITRVAKFGGINMDLKVTARGTGEANLEMVSLYHTHSRESQPYCKFDLNVELLPEQVNENEKIFRLKIQILYKDRDREASMSVLDVGLPAGFTFNKNDLDLLSGRHETNSGLSDRGSLIIHLDKISNVRPEEVSVRIHLLGEVGFIQPVAVSVYEYFDRKHCVKFYHPHRRTGGLQAVCSQDECVCDKETCSFQKKGKVSKDERSAKSCESTIDFVYKVGVEGLTDGSYRDLYTVRIKDVLKQGSIDMNPNNQLRQFLGYQFCREAYGLTTGKSYLIMGSSRDIQRTEAEFQYVLSENMWIEYWPTAAECTTEVYRPTCLALEDLNDMFMMFGCPD